MNRGGGRFYTALLLRPPTSSVKEIMRNAGELSLWVKLPGEMGVRVSAGTGVGSLTSSGLTQDGDVYVNAAYGSSPYTLFVDIQAGAGAIHLAAP